MNGMMRIIQIPQIVSNIEVTSHDNNVIDCHIQVHLSRKLHPCGDATSKTYKPAFHGSYLSRNMYYGSAATLWVFHLP